MITLVDGYKKARLEDFGFRALSSHSNASGGNFDRKLQYIPGRHAPWDFGVQQKGKSMEIPCKSLFKDEADLEKSINKLNAFLLDENKNPRTVKLSYDYEPEKFYHVQLEGPFDPDRSTILKGLSIPFFAGDASKYAESSAYDPKRKILYGEVEKGDYYANTETFDWIYRTHYTGVHNYSPFKTAVRIVINGTVKDGNIFHHQTGKQLTFPDLKNQRCVLNSANKTVEVDRTTVLEGSNYNFFDLVSGDNTFEFEGDFANAGVYFDWLHRF